MKKEILAELKKHSVKYVGCVRHSMKLQASFKHNELTYAIYLAPADSSGYNVCPCSQHCKDKCLSMSGNNKVCEWAAEKKASPDNPIQKARVNKTRWFFEDRRSFVEVVADEIRYYQAYAKKRGYKFSARLNATSDISPEDFNILGFNLLEIFHNVQFYDYTKVYSRLPLVDKYPNYDLTFSYDGYNWKACEAALERGVRVAVVFHDDFPVSFCGYPVVDGNEYDMRYIDPKRCVVGLHYHPTVSDYIDGRYQAPNTPFVIRADDARCGYSSEKTTEPVKLVI